MEFDACTRNSSLSNFEQAKQLYKAHSYRLLQVVFWNIQSYNKQQPVKMNEQGCALVSGCTSNVFSQVTGGEMEPYKNILNVLMSERYAPISV